VLETGSAYVIEFDAFSHGEGGLSPTVPLAEATFISGVLSP
jgi:hypothetical protein